MTTVAWTSDPPRPGATPAATHVAASQRPVRWHAADRVDHWGPAVLRAQQPGRDTDRRPGP